MTTPEASTLPELPKSSPADTTSISRLDDLIAQATAKYALKDYNAAAELYSMATELQAELNGEMSTKNADLLYAYGKCLYHVAVSSSDVLGTKVAGEKAEGKKSKSKPTNGESSKNGAGNGDARVAEEALGVIAEGTESAESATKAVESKPFFHFTGDENWDSDDDDEAAEGEAEEPEDDFSNAFEVLDMARLLLQRKLEELQSEEGKGKGTTDSDIVRQLKERLADTYDLQAEISLEGERFPNAVVDLRSALELKQELFPQGSSLIAEAHFKLSLALEFSSVTQQQDESGAPVEAHAQVDEAMREEAAREMEAAVTSCKIRIEQEEKALAAGDSTNGTSGGKKPKVTRESIEDVKEMVKDMEDRVRSSTL
jgi:HAT1-interacting factor 1